MSNHKLLETKEAFRLNAFLEALVDERCADYKPGIEPLTTFRHKQRLQIEKLFIESLEVIREGISYLLASHHWTKKEKEHYGKLLSDYDKIENGMEKGQSIFASGEIPDHFPIIGEALGLDEHFYDKGLEIAMDTLNHHRIDEAKKCFLALAHINPLIFQFSQGLGLVFLEEKDYDSAMTSFVNALQVADDEHAANVALLVINTLVLSGQYDKAKEAVEILIEQIANEKMYSHELARAKKLLELL